MRNYPICVALAPTHRFARLKSITLEKVAAEPLIGLRRKDYREYYVGLDRMFSPLGIKPRIAVECDSASSLITETKLNVKRPQMCSLEQRQPDASIIPRPDASQGLG